MAVRRFTLIDEAEARRIEPGTTVELDAGGHITPLAQDTLRARRVTVVSAGTVDAALPPDLAPVATIARVALAADHTGQALKSAILAHLRRQGRQVTDHSPATGGTIDYPDTAAAVARAVARGEADAGIVIDGAGLGSAIAANKIRGIRAAMCASVTLARYAREHNGANVLALGATLMTIDDGLAIVDAWMGATIREPRYLRRLLKIRHLEERG